MDSMSRALEALINTPTSKAFFTFLGTILAYVFGIQNTELWVIIGILIILDTITGLLVAKKNKVEITSKRMTDKLITIVVYGVSIAFVNTLVNACKCTTEQCPEILTNGMRIAVIFWIISTESKSVVENLSKLGYKIPAIIEENIQKYFGNKQNIK